MIAISYKIRQRRIMIQAFSRHCLTATVLGMASMLSAQVNFDGAAMTPALALAA